MDHHARKTEVLFRTRSVRTNAKECLQRLLVAARRCLCNFVIIDALLASLLVDLVALFRLTG